MRRTRAQGKCHMPWRQRGPRVAAESFVTPLIMRCLGLRVRQFLLSNISEPFPLWLRRFFDEADLVGRNSDPANQLVDPCALSVSLQSDLPLAPQLFAVFLGEDLEQVSDVSHECRSRSDW